MDRFCVIGSNSFSGSHMINRLLSEGKHVLGISHSPEKSDLFLPYKHNINIGHFKFVRDDIKDTSNIISILNENYIECIINFSAISEVFPSLEDPGEYFETNTLSVINLCRELLHTECFKKFIQISTCEVYGSVTHPVNEQARLNPTTPYAVTKAATDMFLLTFFNHKNFPVSIVRSTSVYGPCQQLYKIIPRVIIRLKEGKLIEIHGNGSMIRTFVHIEDVCNGIFRIANNGKNGRIYNLSSEWRVPLLASIETICDMMGYSMNLCTKYVEERQKQDKDYLLSYNRAKHELKWTPESDLKKKLPEIIQWIESNWEQIKLEKKTYQ